MVITTYTFKLPLTLCINAEGGEPSSPKEEGGEGSPPRSQLRRGYGEEGKVLMVSDNCVY